MSDMPKCTSWLGHKFEGRYSLGAPVKQMDEHWLAIQGTVAIPRIIDASKPKTYERDVCVRCGAVIERKNDTPKTAETQTKSGA
jgi:hypothetical protein